MPLIFITVPFILLIYKSLNLRVLNKYIHTYIHTTLHFFCLSLNGQGIWLYLEPK